MSEVGEKINLPENGFQRLLKSIGSVKFGEEKNINCTYSEDDQVYSFSVEVRNNEGGLEIVVVSNIKERQKATKNNLSSIMKSLLEIDDSTLNSIEVSSTVDESESELSSVVNEVLRRDNQGKEKEIADLRLQIRKMNEVIDRVPELESLIAELQAEIASYEFEKYEIVNPDVEERDFGNGIKIDNLGVMRQKFFSKSYIDNTSHLDKNFNGNAVHTLHALANVFFCDENRGWGGQGLPTGLSNRDWFNRLKIMGLDGYKLEQIYSQPIQKIVRGSGIEYRKDINVPTVELTLDIDERRKKVNGLGPAFAEARMLIGQLISMNKLDQSIFIESLVTESKLGGLGAGRINFTVKMNVHGEKKEIAKISLPTETRKEIKEKYFDK